MDYHFFYNSFCANYQHLSIPTSRTLIVLIHKNFARHLSSAPCRAIIIYPKRPCSNFCKKKKKSTNGKPKPKHKPFTLETRKCMQYNWHLSLNLKSDCPIMRHSSNFYVPSILLYQPVGFFLPSATL